MARLLDRVIVRAEQAGLSPARLILVAGRVGLLSFNDHTPAILRKLADPATAAKYSERCVRRRNIDTDGVLGAANDFEGHVVSAHPQDLLAGRTYHFRVVAHNEKSKAGPTLGEEKVFQTQPAGFGFELPDGRAWELVSPPQKHGALIQHIHEGVIEAANTGNALAYLTAPSESPVLAAV